MSKALCVGTKCATRDQFIESFYRFCDEQSFFVATLNQRPIGLETPFSINLVDRTPMLRGLCVVLDAWATPANPFGRPGIRLGIKRLTPDSEALFAKLTERRACQGVKALPPTPPPPIPTPAPSPPPEAVPAPLPDTVDAKTEPTPSAIARMAAEQLVRTPGSELVLPANPLSNLSDDSLEGFIDCTIYEETGNFFRAPEGEFVDAAGLVVLDADLTAEPPPAPDFAPRRASSPIPVTTAAPPPAPVAAAPPSRPTPPPMPEEARRSTPMAIVPERRALDRRYLIAGGGGVAVLAIVAIALASGGSSSASTDKPATPPDPAAAKPAAEPAAPTKTDDPLPTAAAAKAPVEEPPPTDEPAAAPTTGAAPVVGTGPCTIEVTTTPAGTRVVLDGKEIGPSPITIAGPCKSQKVDLIHPRYKQVTQLVSPSEGKPKKLDVTLIRPTHQLVISTTPPGATISIQGRRAGTTPTTVALMGFSGIDVTITRPGYETVTKRVYSKSPVERLSVPLKRYKW